MDAVSFEHIFVRKKAASELRHGRCNSTSKLTLGGNMHSNAKPGDEIEDWGAYYQRAVASPSHHSGVKS
jgi:hypothetical protein